MSVRPYSTCERFYRSVVDYVEASGRYPTLRDMSDSGWSRAHVNESVRRLRDLGLVTWAGCRKRQGLPIRLGPGFMDSQGRIYLPAVTA